MNNSLLLSPCQLENYSRIPNSLVDSKHISSAFKKILVFLYGIQVNGYIPVCNIIKGWTGFRENRNYTELTSQLRNLLIDLERNGFIERIFQSRKFTAVKLNFDHPLIKEEQYFFLTKKITSDKRLGLEDILIAATYARLNYLNIKYSTKLSALLGMHRNTFNASVKKLAFCGILRTESSKLTQRDINTYTLAETYIIKKYTKKTFAKSLHQSQLDDFSAVRVNIINKIKNNLSMLGIMHKEINNNSKTLTDYLGMTDEELTVTANAVRCNLATRGEVQSLEVVKMRILRIMVQNSRNEKVKFSSDHRLYAYLTNAIGRKNYEASFDPTNNSFIVELRKELPYDIPLQRVRDEVRDAVNKGFMFKTEVHALNFFKARFDKKDLSLSIKEEGRRERISSHETKEGISIHKMSSIGNILSKFNIKEIQ